MNETINILVSMMSITYDKKGHISNVAYKTTLPTEIPPAKALDILTRQVVSRYLSHTERVNGSPKTYGGLSSLTEDIGQGVYCFSIDGQPKSLEQEFDIMCDTDDI